MFWYFSAALVTLASLFVLWPLWRNLRAEDGSRVLRRETNLASFEERRNELEVELASGSLDQQQYADLLLELKKSLLIDTETGDHPVADDRRPSGKNGRSAKLAQGLAVPVLLIAMLPVLAYLLYGLWGKHDDIRLMGLYEQTINAGNDADRTGDLILKLGAEVQTDPDNPWAWYFLGRNFSNAGMFEQSEIAFDRASDLLPDGFDKAATLGLLAQIKYLNNGGEMDSEVLAIVEQARAINPSEMASLQLLALDAEMTQDYETAISYWRLLIQANPNSQQAQQLRERIAAAQQLLAVDDDATGPRIEVHVALADGLELPADLRVFVAARNAQQENMPPLAAIDLVVGDLPAIVTLDNNMAVAPMFNLSSAETIYLTATVSLSGTANVQSGDYRVVSGNFAHNGQHSVVELIIADRVE